MRRVVIEIVGDVFRQAHDRTASLDSLPHFQHVLVLIPLFPNLSPELARVLACGGFAEYDLQLISRVLRDHIGFKRTIQVETFNNINTKLMHVAFKMTFEADMRAAEQSMLAATKPADPPVSSSRRVALRRGISGS